MFSFCHVTLFLVTASSMVNRRVAEKTLHITDHYWEAQSAIEWMPQIYSNDCSFFSAFIETVLIPMNTQVTSTEYSNYLYCSRNGDADSVARIYDICEDASDHFCNAYQHFMFEVSKNSSNYVDIESDNIVDSMLDQTFIHFGLLYNTDASNLSSKIINIRDNSDYKSYLTYIRNDSHIATDYVSFNYMNGSYTMWWKLIATRMSIVLGNSISDINKTQLSQQCDWVYVSGCPDITCGACYGILGLVNQTASNDSNLIEFYQLVK